MAQGLLVQPRPNSGLFQIYIEGGGSPPVVLSGAFTSHREAKLAIDTYRRKNFKPKLTNNTKAARLTAKKKAELRAASADGSKIVGESGKYTTS